jgi:hypothetical protein
MVSRSLRIWFMLHFAVDSIVALPLFLFPEKILKLLGWLTVDPITSRLVASALFAIGTVSFLVRNSDISVFRVLLNFKIIWSLFAISGLLISLLKSDQGRPFILWILLIGFVLFHCIWLYWRITIEKGAKNETRP